MTEFKEVEFGGTSNVRFLDPSQVKMLNDKGEEIEPPKCNACKKQVSTTYIMGKGRTIALCSKCAYGDEPPAKFVYRSPT